MQEMVSYAALCYLGKIAFVCPACICCSVYIFGLGISSVRSSVPILSPVIFLNESGSSVKFSHTKLLHGIQTRHD